MACVRAGMVGMVLRLLQAQPKPLPLRVEKALQGLPGSKLMMPCVAQLYPSMLRTMVSVLPFFSNLRQLLRCEPKMTV